MSLARKRVLSKRRASPSVLGMADNLQSLLGIPVILFLGWLISSDKRRFPWRVVGWGMGLQFVFAYVVLYTEAGKLFFLKMNDLIAGLLAFSEEGAKFVFGGLATGAMAVKEGAAPGSDFLFAFQVLTTIIFFSSLMSVLYYLRIMQWIVLVFAKIMAWTMGTSGAESLSASANIFVGQTEAPLVVKPYVEKMTTSELMAVMTGGFATVAGGVMAAYVAMLHDHFPNIAGHLISASVLSAPASLVLAKVVVPEREEPVTKGEVKMHLEIDDVNVIDAACNGASTGMTLALNVAAMLMAFVALLALINAGLRWIGGYIGRPDLTLQLLLGYLHYPLALAMGVPADDALEVGTLLGEKLVLTEFLAYLHLGQMLADPGVTLDPKSVVIVTYGLCGFANFASIAIQIGGISGIAPTRRHDLARLGLRAMVAGALAAYLTGAVAGVFYRGETILDARAAIEATSAGPTAENAPVETESPPAE